MKKSLSQSRKLYQNAHEKYVDKMAKLSREYHKTIKNLQKTCPHDYRVHYSLLRKDECVVCGKLRNTKIKE